MGAVLLSSHIAETIRPGDHATTFGGGPFVASVAMHVLDRLSDPTLLATVKDNGAWMGARLNRIAATSHRVRAVRGLGYMWGVDVTEPAADVIVRAMRAGLLICSAGEHTVRLLPPLVAERADLEEGLGILAEIMDGAA
jgi:acetylornithine/succinyldiaminopimelate/putrescine aminotransferase